MKTNWAGARVLVVGMKKSGLASAHLLAGLGARVRATDLKPLAELGEAAEALERLAVPFELQTPATFLDCDAVVISPDVPADLAPLEDARNRGVNVIGEVELAAPYPEGAHHRRHRIERQNHHHQPDRPHSARGGPGDAGGRQHRNAGDGDDRDLARGRLERAGAFQFSTRDHPPISTRMWGWR